MTKLDCPIGTVSSLGRRRKRGASVLSDVDKNPCERDHVFDILTENGKEWRELDSVDTLKASEKVENINASMKCFFFWNHQGWGENEEGGGVD